MRFALSAIVALGSYAALATGQTLTHVQINAQNAPQLARQFEAAGFDVLEGSVTENSLDLIVTPQEHQFLLDEGYFPITLAVGRPLRDILREREEIDGVPPGYLNLTEIVAEMNARAAAFPALCKVVDLTATYNLAPTVEGRHMFAAKVSDNVSQDEEEPVLLIVACHHAREIVTPVIALEALNRLTSRYGSDPTVTALVNKYEIWIAPVWNPDGYVYVFDVNNLWRKNRRVFPGGIGCDLNRNYPLGWSAPCSGSTNPASDTYKGPSPASEAETQTLLTWGDDRHFTKVIDYHSSGREVVQGYACLVHPFAAFLRSEGAALSTASGYGGGIRAPSAEGEEQQSQMAYHGAHGFLIETATSFQPDYATAQAEAALVWPGIIWMLQRPIPLTGRVRDAWNQVPVVATLTYQGVVFQNGEVNKSHTRFGRYHAFLPAGNYTVQFAAAGYNTQNIPVTIENNVEKVLDVNLVRQWPLGDCNCDGVTNNFDIDPFVLALTDPAGYKARFPNCIVYNADCNNDGVVDNFDIDPFVRLLTP